MFRSARCCCLPRRVDCSHARTEQRRRLGLDFPRCGGIAIWGIAPAGYLHPDRKPHSRANAGFEFVSSPLVLHFHRLRGFELHLRIQPHLFNAFLSHPRTRIESCRGWDTAHGAAGADGNHCPDQRNVLRQVRLARAGNARDGRAGCRLVSAVQYWIWNCVMDGGPMSGRCRGWHWHIYLTQYQRFDGGSSQVATRDRLWSTSDGA